MKNIFSGLDFSQEEIAKINSLREFNENGIAIRLNGKHKRIHRFELIFVVAFTVYSLICMGFACYYYFVAKYEMIDLAMNYGVFFLMGQTLSGFLYIEGLKKYPTMPELAGKVMMYYAEYKNHVILSDYCGNFISEKNKTKVMTAEELKAYIDKGAK